MRALLERFGEEKCTDIRFGETQKVTRIGFPEHSEIQRCDIRTTTVLTFHITQWLCFRRKEIKRRILVNLDIVAPNKKRYHLEWLAKFELPEPAIREALNIAQRRILTRRIFRTYDIKDGG